MPRVRQSGPRWPKSPPLMTSLTKTCTPKQKIFSSADQKTCHIFCCFDQVCNPYRSGDIPVQSYMCSGVFFWKIPESSRTESVNQKWQTLFWKFHLQIVVIYNSANSSWAWQVCGLLKFQLCIIGVTMVEVRRPHHATPKFLVYRVFCGDPNQILLLT